MPYDPNSWRKRMRKRREALALTQPQLAEKLSHILNREIEQPLISQWENEKIISHPDGGIETYIGIAKALDMNPVHLIFGYDYPTEPTNRNERALFKAIMENLADYTITKKKQDNSV